MLNLFKSKITKLIHQYKFFLAFYPGEKFKQLKQNLCCKCKEFAKSLAFVSHITRLGLATTSVCINSKTS
ncbi:hypothetical protein BpHYR1_028196 [Brachionus plicatilis]|uniref:Uncharacterized protein n=1 Tax=Brachionus plicatilis TaxID=10195 RepID=A0A3M7Q1Z3_BRAPC|nr:hypothetical protein BpHYR1_028196 [Brachionus plicatilis]